MNETHPNSLFLFLLVDVTNLPTTTAFLSPSLPESCMLLPYFSLVTRTRVGTVLATNSCYTTQQSEAELSLIIRLCES